jgi:hypothetical protein
MRAEKLKQRRPAEAGRYEVKGKSTGEIVYATVCLTKLWRSDTVSVSADDL